MTIVLALQITGWIEGSWKKAGDEIYEHIYIQFQEEKPRQSTEPEKSLANQRLTQNIQHQRPEREISKTTKKN